MVPPEPVGAPRVRDSTIANERRHLPWTGRGRCRWIHRLEHHRRARWPRGFECPRCRVCHSSWIATRRLEQCSACRCQCSVTAGTVFHRTRVPLRTWFWTMLHKLRSALRPRPAYRLIGDVEADETCVGGCRPGQVGRGLGKTGVAVAVETRRGYAPGGRAPCLDPGADELRARRDRRARGAGAHGRLAGVRRAGAAWRRPSPPHPGARTAGPLTALSSWMWPEIPSASGG
jgi:hypothetical protein